MDNKCEDCCNFIQHYALNKRRLYKVYFGHCTRPGVRRKHPDTKACECFMPGTKDTDAFATKEYLSKELLHYFLSLELLPEIEEMADAAKQHR
jgi:hypothetical protein